MMAWRRLLIANRGEVALRVLRAAEESGLRAVAVFSEDDASSLHARRAAEARPLRGTGPAAYLDGEAIVAAAREARCDAVHPGYGFLSESAAFARRCERAGLAFVGPRPDVLDLLGDKSRARALADELGVPTLPATPGATDEAGVARLLAASGGGAVALKPLLGGGGRGIRVVCDEAEIGEALARARSEARASFGSEAVYAERWLERARHVEVQVAGDAGGRVVAIGDRECTLQRRHQKLIEIAPSPELEPALRDRLFEEALRLAAAVRLDGLATFEFLLDVAAPGEPSHFFLEANPRLQVEHAITEEVTGLDLVRLQLGLAAGASLEDLGVPPGAAPEPRGVAVELRINAEEMRPDGPPRPAAGRIAAFEPPTGPGLRIDTHAYAGYELAPRFDSLLAKLVARSSSPRLGDALSRARRGLRELRIEGVATNLGFLERVLAHPEVVAWRVTTAFLDERAAELVPAACREPGAAAACTAAPGEAGEPLAALAEGASGAVHAPLAGTVVEVAAAEGDVVAAGRGLVVLEAMKMQHVVAAPFAGRVLRLVVRAGDAVAEGDLLATLEPAAVGEGAGPAEAAAAPDLERLRPELAEVVERHALGLDAARPEAAERRHRRGQRTARENVADLCDEGSFVEYGPLVIAAQRRRRSLEELVARTPADGLIAGIGTVNAGLFGPEASRCVVLSYDYTVLAGTQGAQNHRKKDRLFELARRLRAPVVLFTEGGGGRPGDTDAPGVSGLDCLAFRLFGELSGMVPLVGIASGRCFAGNAALLGCCDVVIATADSNIGMGGPAMIEGGGLGVFRPEEIGPLEVQARNGVVDLAVADEAEAVRVARRYLSYFQGRVAAWECADQRLLRTLVPEQRMRVYDVRRVVETLADAGSVLELRRDFGRAVVTALARVEGRPLGVVANDPAHLGGAIDADAADKAARFLALCDGFDLPVVSLCDTPGILVGPEAEKAALVRHACRLFVVGASLDVPFFTIVLRKGYGLGAQAMAGGSFRSPLFTVAWPTGEFGGMGLEGAVKLGFRRELEAVDDPERRQALYEEMVARAYDHGKALNVASHFEIDDVIDPADSRRWIAAALAASPPPAPRRGKKRPCVDPW